MVRPARRLQGMTDADRVRLARADGSMMIGPIERQRCHQHPRRWETYRWRWRAEDGIESADVERIGACGSCQEDEAI